MSSASLPPWYICMWWLEDCQKEQYVNVGAFYTSMGGIFYAQTQKDFV